MGLSNTKHYTTGYYPALTKAHKELSEKYLTNDNSEYNVQITEWLTNMKKLIDKINDSADALEQARGKTLAQIYTALLNKLPGTSVKGGKGDGETVDIELERHPSIIGNNPEKVQAFEPPAVSQPEPETISKPDSETPAFEPPAVSQPEPEKHDPIAISVAQTILNENIAKLLHDVDKNTLMRDTNNHIMNEFISYWRKIDSVEEISLNNRIALNNISHTVALDGLAEKIAAQMKSPSDLLTKYVHSLIVWYLLHNNTRGIDYDEYHALLSSMQTTDPKYKKFIDSFNQYFESV